MSMSLRKTGQGMNTIVEDLSVLKSLQFEEKWKRVLAHIPDQWAYSLEVMVNGRDQLATKHLEEESQEHIDGYRKAISREDILVLVHPYCSFVSFKGTRQGRDNRAEHVYVKNLERLLGEKDSDKVDCAIFDYPELYVLDSSQRLAAGQVQTVILTCFDAGASLHPGRAREELGAGKRIYLAGSYPCLATTAKELQKNGNKVLLVRDAALGIAAEIEYIKLEFGLEEMTTITTREFLQRYGKSSQ